MYVLKNIMNVFNNIFDGNKLKVTIKLVAFNAMILNT